MLDYCSLRDYARMRNLSLRDIEAYCDLDQPHISMIFNGRKPLTDYSYRELVNGINAAYAAKKNGTFTRPPLDAQKKAIDPEKAARKAKSREKRSKNA